MATKAAGKRAVRSRDLKAAGHPGVRAHAVLQFASEEANDLASRHAGIAASIIENRKELHLDLLISENSQLITVIENGSPTFSTVQRGRDGSGFWDHQLQAFAEFGPADRPHTKLRPGQDLVVRRRAGADSIRVEIEVDDPDLGSIVHELTFSRRPDLERFGPPLFKALYCGPDCHADSSLPYEELSQLGFVTAARTFRRESGELLTHLRIEIVEVGDLKPEAFKAPRNYAPLSKVVKEKPVEPREQPAPPTEPIGEELEASESLPGNFTLRMFEENLSPDCLGSTRFGSIAATVHQDFFDHVAAAVNTAAPLLGSTAIAGGVWTIPWLSSLRSIASASATAPGSGIYCFLRDPRIPSAPSKSASGGTGLLDRIAWDNLIKTDTQGLTLTQRAFRDGTLGSTLISWGILGAPAPALFNASGDLNQLTVDERIAVVEAYQTAVFSTIRVPGLPTALSSFPLGSLALPGNVTTPSLMNVGVAGIGGTVNFATLAGRPVLTATIGSSGNVGMRIALPRITLTATITRSMTLFGGVALFGGSVALCWLMPFVCPVAVELAIVTAFIMNNVTAVTVTATGVTTTLNCSWGYDPSSGRVDPTVTLTGSTGTVTVINTWVTPNVLANIFDSLALGIVNLFNGWLPILAQKIAEGVEQGLIAAGFTLPVADRQREIRASGGGAFSTANRLLRLRADVQPVAALAAQPFVTQVNESSRMEAVLTRVHLDMRDGLNPQPTPTPPTPPPPSPVITVGSYLGLALSQNVLNYYLFAQWRAKLFEAQSSDPALIKQLVQKAPPSLFPQMPTHVHVWPASPPRVETAPFQIASGGRPLILFFDDVRACFQVPSVSKAALLPGSAVELSFNLKTTATIRLAWPFLFDLVLDDPAKPVTPSEPRSWEFVDPARHKVMETVPTSALDPLLDLLSALLLSQAPRSKLGKPPSPRAWHRVLIAMQQEMLESAAPPGGGLDPQQFYLEILHHKKVLYALAALDTYIMQLLDGSGAPLLNELIRNKPPAAPVSFGTMTCSHGAILRGHIPMLSFP